MFSFDKNVGMMMAVSYMNDPIAWNVINESSISTGW